MTIDDYIERRNTIYLKAENVSSDLGNAIWTELGVANRHIERVVEGTFPLSVVEGEIQKCLDRVEKISASSLAVKAPVS